MPRAETIREILGTSPLTEGHHPGGCLNCGHRAADHWLDCLHPCTIEGCHCDRFIGLQAEEFRC